MAKRKEKKDLYGGFDLFDFISDEIETGLEILENSIQAKGEENVHESSELSDDRGSDRQGEGDDISVRSDIKIIRNKNIRTLFDADIGEVVSDIPRVDGESVGQHHIQNAQISAEDGAGRLGRLQNDGGNEKRSIARGDTSDERSGFIRLSSDDEKQRGLSLGREDAKDNAGGLDREEGENDRGDGRGWGGREGDKQDEGMGRASEKRDYKQLSEIIIGGNKDKYAKNIEAIKLLKQLDSENRYPTEQEQVTLASYSGWGGLPQVFDPENSTWSNEYKELRELLTSKEYEAARASTPNSHYTPQLLVDSIYQGLDRLGFSSSEEEKLILEPSAGAGAFIAFSEYQQKNIKFECVELDSITNRLLKNLYPNQKIYDENPFQQVDLADNRYDAVVGNPPFGEVKLYDEKNTNISGFSIHNYFLAKSIDKLKPDGIAAFVVSSYFMDARNNETRKYIADRATFLGAVRLPNNALKNGGTKVTADIVFFKKGQQQEFHKNFLDVDVRFSGGTAFYINQYFLNHPQNILGELKYEMRGRHEEQQCVSDGRDLGQALENFIKSLPANIYEYHKYEPPSNTIIANKERAAELFNGVNIKVGNLFVYQDKVCIRRTNQGDDIVYEILNVSDREKSKIRSMTAIRNQMNLLINLQKQHIGDNDIRLLEERQKLNTLYDSFEKKEGHLNRDSNKKAFGMDIEANKLISLEKNYNSGISESTAKRHGVKMSKPSAQKADIFTKRVISPFVMPNVSTPEEALAASLSVYGKIDKYYISSLLPAMKENDIIQELIDKEAIYKDHTLETNYVVAAKYLSGNVKKKLKQVKELFNQDKSLYINMQALEKVVPKDIEAADISVSIGATWIPLKYYEEFFAKTLKISQNEINIDYHKGLNEWSIEIKMQNIPANIISEFASQRVGIKRIAQHLLEQSPIIVRDTVVGDDGKDKMVVNAQETAIANQKAEKLSIAFNEWIWSDYERRAELQKLYNDIFNTHIAPRYDGQDLQLMNFSPSIDLRKHQKDAIKRSIFEKNILLDHEVGAGKTYEAICSVMERKRMGTVNKPLVAVPNHLLAQWQGDFTQAYPDANILVATKKDLLKENREIFFAKIASNNYDAIIMTHSQFGKIAAPYEIIRKKMNEELFMLKEIMEREQNKEGGSRFTVKQQEKRIASLNERLNKLAADNKKSKSMDFSDLGIDMLVIDEAHEYKNLSIITKMQVNGLGNTAGSQKAYNMHAITEYLNGKNQSVMFLTGTPIANSISEVYNLQRYLQPNVLREKGIENFDSWAKVFGEVTQSYELDSSGVNYKLVSRFAKFKNIPELLNYYHSTADVITNTDIEKYTKNYIPKTAGGKPANIVVKRSDDVARYIGIRDENGNWNEGSIVWRMDNFEKDPRRNNVLACTTDARKAGLDYRLIDPSGDDFEKSKVNAAVDNIYSEWKHWKENRGTQLVFCDLSTPKKHSQNIVVDENLIKEEKREKAEDEGDDELSMLSEDEIIAKVSRFDVYSDIIDKLEAKGVPRDEIRFIHDAKTDLQKGQLFQDVRDGKIRILVGSTQKMGAGMNVQNRLVAIHHLDCPWRPADLKQRNGRVYRQGNEFFNANPEEFTIKEFRYATEMTYDARMWQVIETKAKAIEQFRQGANGLRKIDDISMDAANAAEMKAEATGNPLILLQIQLASELKKLEMEHQGFMREIYQREDRIKYLQGMKPHLEKNITELQKAIQIRNENTNTNENAPFKVILSNGRQTVIIHKDDDSIDNKNAQEKLNSYLFQNLRVLPNDNENIQFFEYRGFEIAGWRKGMSGVKFSIIKDDIEIESENLSFNERHEVSARGLFTRINNVMSKLENRIDQQQENIEKYQKELRELQSVEAKTFPKLELLYALREDNSRVIEEIKKSSKGEYKENWKPKSEIVKEAKKGIGR